MSQMQSPPGPEAVIDGRRYLYFAGTAYYGLQGHPAVIRAACEATERYGIASATTRAWFGATPPLLEAEQRAAEFFATESAFYYATGYAGMQILLAGLAIDDAHGVGVLGANGRGTYESENLAGFGSNLAAGERPADQPALFWCGTTSKAFGGYGGLIAGSKALLKQIHAGSHWFEGASSPPVPVAAATACGIRLLAEHPEMRARLRENVRAVKQGLAALGLETNETAVPIVCLRIGTAERMRRIQQALADEGILVAYAAAYSGLGAEGALRLAVCSEHAPAMIARLVESVGRLVKTG